MTNIDKDSNLKVPYYIEINGITIFSSSVNCLSPQSWLNDSIVDLTVSIVLTNLEADLASAKLKVHCFSTLIWSVILRNFNNPDEEESFKKYPDISNMDFVFFPIVHFNHFSCVVVDNMKDLTNDNDLCDLCIYHMDSLVGIHDQEHSIDVIKHFLLRKYGIDEQKKKKIINARISKLLPTPQQTNSWDCGLFVSENIRYFLKGAIDGKRYDETENFKFQFSQSDICLNRQNLYSELQNVFAADIDKRNCGNTIALINCFYYDRQINPNNSENLTSKHEIMSSKNYSMNKISSDLSTTDTKWESSNEINIVQFFAGKSRTYIKFTLPLQCTNAPQRVPLYYRQDYDRFVIYAHFEVDAVVLKGKVYFSMCALYNPSSSSNFILAAIAFTTCTAPVRRYWVFDRAAKRFLEWNDKQISSYSCVPSIEFDESELINVFRHNLINERKLYDVTRGIKFTSKNAAKAYDDIPDLDKFDGSFDESYAEWTGTRDPIMWQQYLHKRGINY